MGQDSGKVVLEILDLAADTAAGGATAAVLIAVTELGVV